jgi:RES domain-containing protein
MPGRRSPAFIHWSGIAYRATTYDVPLWVNPNRREGRWNIASQDCTQYMSLDPLAPMAEMLRHEDLRTDQDASHYRTTLWEIRVEEGSVIDYGTFEKAAAAGFSPDALVEDDHERCQAEAQWLRNHGARAILSPSAALPGSVNLTLFGPRVQIPWASPVTLASTMPVQRLPTGSPPPGLAARVRFVGQPHAGLLAHQEAIRRGSAGS